MSIAIAHIENSEIFLMTDTQLTSHELIGDKPDFGMKLFFLDKHIAIAFAGAATLAYKRLMAIFKQGRGDSIRLLAEQISKSFDDEVDFLICQTGEMPTIAKVSRGIVSCTSGKEVYWIGDSAAAQFIADSGTHNCKDLAGRLNKAIADPRFSTVGGLAVIARGKLNGFSYIPRMLLTSPKYSAKENEWQTVDFGNAHNGGFAYTTVTPKQLGKNGWGVFYFQGKFGEYWHSDFETDTLEHLKAHAEKVEQFIKLIEEDIGVELEFCGSLG